MTAREVEPTFQVVIPTYNASRWLREALASVSGHAGGEILVVDDGSTQTELARAREICSAFPDVRFFSRSHAGIASTLNFAIAQTTAPYIARMDADDISLPGRFDGQIAMLAADPRLAVVGGQLISLGEDGTVGTVSTHYPTEAQEIAKCLARAKNPFIHPSVMMRREAVLEVGGYRTAAEPAEDYDLWLRLGDRWRFANLAVPVIHYRRHPGQITGPANWRQKAAHDLCTLAAERRGAGRTDPIAAMATNLATMPADGIGDADVDSLVAAHRVLASANGLEPGTALLDWMIRAPRRRLLGQSSRARAAAMARVARLARAGSHSRHVLRAYLAGLTLHPAAFLRSLRPEAAKNP
ncbi:MAG: glycosyltransferase [Bauldia sp.]